MLTNDCAAKLKILPVQVIETTDGVILKRGCAEVKITGDGACEVLHLVLSATAGEGATMEEICQLFAATNRSTVEHFMQQLVDRRFFTTNDTLEVSSDNPESSLDIFCWHFHATEKDVARRLNNHRIIILGVNYISRQLASSLSSSGTENFEIIDHPLLRNLRMFNNGGVIGDGIWHNTKTPLDYEKWASGRDPKSFDCILVTSDFGNCFVTREWNEFCVKQNRHFLPVILHDLIGYVGPLVIPGETACFECLRARQNSHLRDPKEQRLIEDTAFQGQVVVGFHPSMASILGNIAAFELIKLYSGALPRPKVGTLIEVNMLGTKLTSRKVLKVPRCIICSQLNSRSFTALQKSVLDPVSASRK